MISLTRAESHAFSEEDAQLVSAFSGHAAIALENARLYEEISALNEGLEQTVTERTDALNQAYQNLERLDKTKSDFINVMAHELRTPLTVVHGYAQVLSKVDEVHSQDGASQEMLAGVLSGVERLQEIVDNMLDVAKIEHEALDLQKEATSIERLVRQAQARLSEALQTRRINLLVENLAHLPVIQADPDLLYKVFHHLLINAIKYVPDGGSIRVSGRIISNNSHGAGVEVKVSDTGIGIDPVDHRLIFEKFYQTGEVAVHSSGRTKFKGGGPGLGLAIVSGIIVAHGGKIWVESQRHDEGSYPGSHFYFLLPLT
jgi:signal transduction histidine kinase